MIIILWHLNPLLALFIFVTFLVTLFQPWETKSDTLSQLFSDLREGRGWAPSGRFLVGVEL